MGLLSLLGIGNQKEESIGERLSKVMEAQDCVLHYLRLHKKTNSISFNKSGLKWRAVIKPASSVSGSVKTILEDMFSTVAKAYQDTQNQYIEEQKRKYNDLSRQEFYNVFGGKRIIRVEYKRDWGFSDVMVHIWPDKYISFGILPQWYLKGERR